MDYHIHHLATTNLLIARASSNSTQDPTTQTRPSIYKAIGIALAIASGSFIGVSFVLKKIGLLKANEKYDEAAGEGYGYLRNVYWWTGMSLMIIGEICNFVAYAFVDAILVTPLGALSVVITTILSAIFLKERLSMVGKVGCFLCIVGSVIIVMNAPAESSAANIQEMQQFVIAPGFLSYASLIIVGCVILIIWVAPRYGKKSMMIYISICSLIGGLSVVATQGLGAAIVAQIGGTLQYNQWFLYVLFVFVLMTLITEKALNIFNAALVTPTYYVFFTSSTIITSAILFRGFKGSVTSIITMVNGFLVICAGVLLLQFSKSAKDVPDTAVFTGDLDQVRTIAEQDQPESEPKADAIRATSILVRRFSSARNKRELEEARRLHEEIKKDHLRLEEGYQDADFRANSLRRRMKSRTMPLTLPKRAYRDPDTNSAPRLHLPLEMSQFPVEFDTVQGNDSCRRNSSGPKLGPATLAQGSILESRPWSNNHPKTQNPKQLVSVNENIDPTSLDSSGQQHLYHDETVPSGPDNLESTVNLEIKPKNTEIYTANNEVGRKISPQTPLSSGGRKFSFQTIFRKVSSTINSSHSEDHVTTHIPSKKLAHNEIEKSFSTSNSETEAVNLQSSSGESNLVELKHKGTKLALHDQQDDHQEERECSSNGQEDLHNEKRKEDINTILERVTEEVTEKERYEQLRNKWLSSKNRSSDSAGHEQEIALV